MLLRVLYREESFKATTMDCLGHRVVGSSSSTRLHLGHAELRLQEQVQATVGQQQRLLEDPGEYGR